MTTNEHYKTIVRCGTAKAFATLLSRVVREWGDECWDVHDGQTDFVLILHGEPARRMSDIAHEMGWKMRGWTEIVEAGDDD